MPNWALIQLTSSQTRRPITHIRRTTASMIINGWWERAAARGTMCNLRWQIEITAQIRIMKSIHSAGDKRRKPQINNNTAINPIRSPNRHRIVIKCRLFNRHLQPISSSTNKSDPSTSPIHSIPTDGICSLKIICENPREFPGRMKTFFVELHENDNERLIEFQFLAAGDDKKVSQSLMRLKFNIFSEFYIN
jgi:hypothetical protein